MINNVVLMGRIVNDLELKTTVRAFEHVAFPNEREADKVRARLPATLQTFVAKGFNVSPLHALLNKAT